MAGSVCCKILDMVMDLLKAGALELGIKLTEVQIEQFETYFRELVNWNQKINITRITDYSEAQVKHFIDSLSIFGEGYLSGIVMSVVLVVLMIVICSALGLDLKIMTPHQLFNFFIYFALPFINLMFLLMLWMKYSRSAV